MHTPLLKLLVYIYHDKSNIYNICGFKKDIEEGKIWKVKAPLCPANHTQFYFPEITTC